MGSESTITHEQMMNHLIGQVNAKEQRITMELREYPDELQQQFAPILIEQCGKIRRFIREHSHESFILENSTNYPPYSPLAQRILDNIEALPQTINLQFHYHRTYMRGLSAVN